jgi:hypothetical protein
MSLAGASRPEAGSRERTRRALQAVQSPQIATTLKYVMAAAIGFHLGSAIAGIFGLLIGGLGVTLAAIAAFYAGGYGLGIIGGAVMGCLSGAAGGALGGLIKGATLGISNTRIRAVVALGGRRPASARWRGPS